MEHDTAPEIKFAGGLFVCLAIVNGTAKTALNEEGAGEVIIPDKAGVSDASAIAGIDVGAKINTWLCHPLQP